MAELTDFYSVYPILSVGLLRNARLAILPFYHVIVIQGTETKQLLVNYTFGENDKFETEIGSLKLGLFKSIQPAQDVSLVYIAGSESADNMAWDVRRWLRVAPNGSAALFVWPRQYNDDKPFFRALDLENGVCSTTDLTTLKALGLTVSAPYLESSAFDKNVKLW